MEADIFKDVLVPVIGGLGIFLLGLEFVAAGHPGLGCQQDARLPC